MIQENLTAILATIPSNVTLVAVTKTKPVVDLEEVYKAGQRIFGENKVQEMVEKYDQLPKDIQWHLIGHLQTNKVKYIAPYVHLIHSVDSLKLLAEINKQGAKCQRVISVLLQFYIAKEETKFGLDFEDTSQLLNSEEYKSFKNIQVVGVMGMASFTDDELIVKEEFSQLKELFSKLKSTFFQHDDSFKEISMGMSGDYQLAIEQGSTMVRVGSSIFGGR
jgi:pyridoxal phosphate enzyme (YggS family)